ncbi:MAG: helix-turn-helix domain-containing protein [Candidatus Limnocylindria bacterium]
MPFRIRPLDEAIRRSSRETIELGEELARGRRTCGATQADVARTLGWSPSKVRRIERGQRRSVTHLELASFASVVGLRYSGRMFIGTTRLRDATQLEMIGGYRTLAAGCGWNCRIEDPIPITGDLRAFDLMLRAPGMHVAHEFISRVYDLQAQVRPSSRNSVMAAWLRSSSSSRITSRTGDCPERRMTYSTISSRSVPVMYCRRSARAGTRDATGCCSGGAGLRRRPEPVRSGLATPTRQPAVAHRP